MGVESVETRDTRVQVAVLFVLLSNLCHDLQIKMIFVGVCMGA